MDKSQVIAALAMFDDYEIAALQAMLLRRSSEPGRSYYDKALSCGLITLMGAPANDYVMLAIEAHQDARYFLKMFGLVC